MANATEPLRPGAWLKDEAPNLFSREEITILAGSGSARALTSGMVLGKRTVDTVPTTGTADGGNTGDGTLTTVTGGTKTQAGIYKVRNVKVVANLGDFEVVAPDGNVIGIATVGTVFAHAQINLTLNDGGTDFALEDFFTITVTGDDKFVQFDEDGIDGSQNGSGVLLLDKTAPDGTDATGVAVVRHAVVGTTLVVWPSTTTAGEKTAALLQLEALGILNREAA